MRCALCDQPVGADTTGHNVCSSCVTRDVLNSKLPIVEDQWLYATDSVPAAAMSAGRRKTGPVCDNLLRYTLMTHFMRGARGGSSSSSSAPDGGAAGGRARRHSEGLADVVTSSSREPTVTVVSRTASAVSALEQIPCFHRRGLPAACVCWEKCGVRFAVGWQGGCGSRSALLCAQSPPSAARGVPAHRAHWCHLAASRPSPSIQSASHPSDTPVLILSREQGLNVSAASFKMVRACVVCVFVCVCMRVCVLWWS
jgi:hypothetical protein